MRRCKMLIFSLAAISIASIPVMANADNLHPMKCHVKMVKIGNTSKIHPIRICSH